MGFLSVLGKIGKAVFVGVRAASPLLPFLRVGGAFGKIAALVGIAERVGDVVSGPGTGAKKAEALLPLSADVIAASEIVAGREILNQTLFLQGVLKIQDGTHDVLKSLKAD